ncbi:MAG TPA: alpha/beta hydrolase [Solirubrobacterales bacterium]|jgi:pimeloyl-ACP methyl ester carboxylesterase
MLAVERLGEGPPIVFVHGDIVGPSLTWRKQRELAGRWTLIIPSRPGFGESAPLERNDFEIEAPMFAELLGDGAHLVGHSYGSVIALLAAAERPDAVRSLTVSEPGCLRIAEGTPEVDEMIANGELLFANAESIPSEEFLKLFRGGAGSAYGTPDQLPDELMHGVKLLKRERPSWEAEIPLERLAASDFPVLVLSGGHSLAFEAVCDALAEALSAEREVIRGRGHTVPSTGDPYNERLEEFLRSAE